MIKHKHHIIPKHAGGTDELENIIELTVEEHAEAHRLLYEQYGRIEDKWAWLGLSGQIGKDELMIEISKAQKGKKKPDGFGDKVRQQRLGKKHTPESISKMSSSKKGKKLSLEHIENMRQKRIGSKQPEIQKIKVAEKLSCKCIITKPNGDTFEITNLRKYCVENNLDQGRNLLHSI